MPGSFGRVGLPSKDAGRVEALRSGVLGDDFGPRQSGEPPA